MLPQLAPIGKKGSMKSIQYIDDSIEGGVYSRISPTQVQFEGMDHLPQIYNHEQDQLFHANRDSLGQDGEYYLNLRNSAVKELLPQSDIGQLSQRKNDNNRFVFSKATQDEFGIKDQDVPLNMRRELDDTVNYTNHVD